jgi:hypothetical protein
MFKKFDWVDILISSIAAAAFTSYFEITIDVGYLLLLLPIITLIIYLKNKFKKK